MVWGATRARPLTLRAQAVEPSWSLQAGLMNPALYMGEGGGEGMFGLYTLVNTGAREFNSAHVRMPQTPALLRL